MNLKEKKNLKKSFIKNEKKILNYDNNQELFSYTDNDIILDKNLDSNNLQVFQDTIEQEIKFEDSDTDLKTEDDFNKYYNDLDKVENNIISSLEFIWSEIRSDNVLEEKSFSGIFETDSIYLKDRIPKNTLDEVFQVPKKLEHILNFSMLLCFDTILYDLTFLPINSLIAFLKLILLLFIMLKNYLLSKFIFKLKFNDINENEDINDSIVKNNLESKKIMTWEYISDKKKTSGIFINNNENTDIEKFFKNENLLRMRKNISNLSSVNNNESVEYLFEEKQIKSRSLFDINELENKMKHKIYNKTKDDGFLFKNNNLLPHLKNYIYSYKMNDQKSSFEESELQSISNSEIFQNELNESINDYDEYDKELENNSNYNLKLKPIELTDLSRFMALLFSISVFSLLDISFFYHYIRGQGLLKLYVIFNMLEVFEKLFRSFGRDLIDSYLESVLYYFSYLGFVRGKFEENDNDIKNERFKEIKFTSALFKYFILIIYLLIHCIIHMIRGLALNISLNSSEYTMFLIVVTNNFAEIKSTVFKTYHSISLFTVACSDSIERFQLLYDGLILFIRMYSNTRLYSNSIYISVITWIVSVFMVEIIVDWFKHCFLVKFNKIKSSCYSSYVDTLIGDVLLSRGSNLALEYLLEEKDDIDKEKILLNKNRNNNKTNIINSTNLKYNNYVGNSSSISTLTRQSTYSLMRGNTIGLEVDVSLLQNKEEFKSKRKNENEKIEYKDKDIIFISKKLRGIYAFPYIISRRIGFVSLPLTVLLMRVILFSKLHSKIHINHLITIWFILFILKYLSSILIVSFSQNNIERLKNWNLDFNKINAL